MYINQNGELATESDCSPKPFVRHPFCRVRFVTPNDEPSMTQEADRDQTDVDAIVARFERTGILPTPNMENAQYGDVSEFQGDLTERLNYAKNVVDTANQFADNWKPAEPETPPPDNPAPPPAAAP